jgi:folate-binding protein YgfZ
MNIAGYEAVRRSAGLIESARRGLLQVTGADRAGWLQGLLTNDVVALAPGQGCYAAYLTPQGRMISDVVVLALDGALLLEVPASTAGGVRDRLDLYVITEDVKLDDVSGGIGIVSVHGPESAGVVARWASAMFDEDEAALRERLGALPEHWHVRIDPAGAASMGDSRIVDALGTLPSGSALVAGSRAYGVTGFDLYVPVSLRAAVKDAVNRAGAAMVGADIAETLRIEAGRPEFGVDMDQETIPLETGVEDRMISFTKGCYVGQEVIVRVRDRGHGRVARRLTGLVSTAPGHAASARRLARGATLLSAGREVGRLTSVGYSPALEREIALGYVHRDFLAPGSRLEAVGIDARTVLEVAALPLDLSR